MNWSKIVRLDQLQHDYYYLNKIEILYVGMKAQVKEVIKRAGWYEKYAKNVSFSGDGPELWRRWRDRPVLRRTANRTGNPDSTCSSPPLVDR